MRQEHLQTLPCKEEENRTLGSACRVPFLIFTEDRRYASGNWEQVPAVFFSAFTIFAEDRIRFSNLCVQARTIALTFHYLCPGGVSVRIVYPGSSDWFKKIVTMYRIIVSLLFVFGLYGGVSAQSLASFKERLSQPAGSAAVTVVEHGDAAGVVSRESQSTTASGSKGTESVFSSITERRPGPMRLPPSRRSKPHSRIFRSIWFMKIPISRFLPEIASLPRRRSCCWARFAASFRRLI